jgi:hypothetical protein
MANDGYVRPPELHIGERIGTNNSGRSAPIRGDR